MGPAQTLKFTHTSSRAVAEQETTPRELCGEVRLHVSYCSWP